MTIGLYKHALKNFALKHGIMSYGLKDFVVKNIFSREGLFIEKLLNHSYVSNYCFKIILPTVKCSL